MLTYLQSEFAKEEHSLKADVWWHDVSLNEKEMAETMGWNSLCEGVSSLYLANSFYKR